MRPRLLAQEQSVQVAPCLLSHPPACKGATCVRLALLLARRSNQNIPPAALLGRLESRDHARSRPPSRPSYRPTAGRRPPADSLVVSRASTSASSYLCIFSVQGRSRPRAARPILCQCLELLPRRLRIFASPPRRAEAGRAPPPTSSPPSPALGGGGTAGRRSGRRSAAASRAWGSWSPRRARPLRSAVCESISSTLFVSGVQLCASLAGVSGRRSAAASRV